MSRIYAVVAPLAVVALLGLAACEPESSNPPNNCGPANCGGCCTPAGVCAAGADPNSCGSGGAACQACGGLQCITGICQNPGPTCNSTNCNGCCSGDTCNSGQDKTACGSAGGACQLCGGDESCVAGVCGKVCDATTCPTGCCENGVCIGASQQGVQRCGVGGQACKICGNGEQCTNQACTATACNATTCPTGCCDSAGNCKTGQSDSACGTAGGTCATCDTSQNQKCQGGTCQTIATSCNATTCATGCCNDQGQCVPGNAADNCGTGGVACSQCGSNLQCVGQKCACTTTSCPGCCDGDTCKAGSDINFCGTAGAACAKCTGTDKCLAGTCQTDCSFLTCKGCCNGTSCVEPTNVSNCGAYGSACASCGGTDTCENGTCNDAAKCNSSNCPTGCCKNGVCQVGTFNDACGENGKVCELCGQHLYCGKDPYYFTQECLATNSSTWDVIVSKVTLNSNPTSPWDSFIESPLPDVYVEVTVGTQTGKTSQKDNQFTPTFDDYVLTASAADLATKISFKVYDKDFIGSDLIGSCTDVIYPSELKDGYILIPGCGGDPANKDVLSIEFKFVVKGK